MQGDPIGQKTKEEINPAPSLNVFHPEWLIWNLERDILNSKNTQALVNVFFLRCSKTKLHDKTAHPSGTWCIIIGTGVERCSTQY